MTMPDNAVAVYAAISGGPELLAWFGGVPTFGDGEVVGLDLRRRSESRLTVHGWIVNRDDVHGSEAVRHAVVTFHISDIVDLKLAGFSHQNVISSLHLRRVAEHAPRPALTPLPSPPEVYEIEMEPCFGLRGTIRCRQLSIAFEPRPPADAASMRTP